MRVPKSKELADKLQSITSPGRKKNKKQEPTNKLQHKIGLRNKSREEVATGFD
jgi:hypothetical protein